MPKPIKIIKHADHIEMMLLTKTDVVSVLYDIDDHAWLSGYTWTVNHEYYVHTRLDGKNISMHRLILGILDDSTLECDHRNRNPLDNRRRNLRISTSQGNKRNRTPWGQVQYLGVNLCKLKYGVKYQASIKPDIHMRQMKLGRFDSAIDAAKHYDSAAAYFFGEYANLNFPDETPLKFDEWFDLNKLNKPKRTVVTMKQISATINVIKSERSGFFITDVYDKLKSEYGIWNKFESLQGNINIALKSMIHAKTLNRRRVPLDRQRTNYWYFTDDATCPFELRKKYHNRWTTDADSFPASDVIKISDGSMLTIIEKRTNNKFRVTDQSTTFNIQRHRDDRWYDLSGNEYQLILK